GTDFVCHAWISRSLSRRLRSLSQTIVGDNGPGARSGPFFARRAERIASMTKKMLWGWFAVVLVGGLAAPARAADEVAQPYIVLVGINKYEDKQILPRDTAEADATALYDLFTSQDYLGVDAKHVKLLLGSADDKRGAEAATKANILQATTWLAHS